MIETGSVPSDLFSDAFAFMLEGEHESKWRNYIFLYVQQAWRLGLKDGEQRPAIDSIDLDD